MLSKQKLLFQPDDDSDGDDSDEGGDADGASSDGDMESEDEDDDPSVKATAVNKAKLAAMLIQKEKLDQKLKGTLRPPVTVPVLLKVAQ